MPVLLDVAHRLTERLAQLHARAGVHGALCPELVKRESDSGLTILQPTTEALAVAARYAAPEQSGRLARDVDERADLYSLGVILYELATGMVPFTASGPAALVRAQLTQTPAAALSRRADLPPGIDAVVTRLLARLPEDRYRSARGVLTDLRRCRDDWAANRAVPAFPLGHRDVPDRLSFPGRLYGRQGRLTQLFTARDRVGRGSGVELLAISSDPGLGKTALLGAFGDGVVMDGGLVARTAFEVTDVAPYAALSRLLTDLVDQLAVHSGGDLGPWRTKLAEELGGSAPVLVELAPALAELTGQPSTGQPIDQSGMARTHGGLRDTLGGLRAQALLRLGIRRLLSTVAGAAGPLVLLVDDLHRADEASVDLLRYVLSDPDSTSLLVVAALRLKEIPVPVSALLRDHGTGRAGALSLRPLPDSALTELLADTLRARQQDAADLARAVAGKTGSRPLAVAEFLRGLCDKGVLRFDQQAGAWQWERLELSDMPAIQDALPAVQDRLTRLPAEVLRPLQVAAVLGGPAGPATLLARAMGATAAELFGPLRAAVREGLLVVAPGHDRYRWPHEVIRRAVVATQPESQRRAVATNAARALLADAGATPAHRIVTLCPSGTSLPESTRAELATQALTAGRHAYRIGAVDVARDRMRTATKLLNPGGWAQRGPLAHAVHLYAARTAREAGDLAQADNLLDLAAGYAGADDLAQAEVLAMRARWRRADGQEALARAATRQALDLLGQAVPADATRRRAAARTASAALTRRLVGADPDRFAAGQPATDSRVVFALEIIADAMNLRDEVDDWTALLAATGVRLAFEFGPTPAAALAFAGHAAALAHEGGYRDLADAAAAARIALAVVDRCPASGYPVRVAPIVAQVRALWYDSGSQPLARLSTAYRTGIEDGEPVLALDNLLLSVAHRLVLGTPLGALADEIETLCRLVERHHADRLAAPAAALSTALARLEGRPLQVCAPVGDSIVARTVTALVACVGGDPARALEVLPEPPAEDGGLLAAVATFYHALALTAEYPKIAAERQESTRTRLREIQAMLDDWAVHGPAAFDAYAALLAAELARLDGDAAEASVRYQRAVDTARKQSLAVIEGLAAHLGGRHELARGTTADAGALLRRARDCYQRWGASTLVAQVDQILASVPTRPHRTFDQLDVLAIVRAFQTIAGELSVERLVVTLLKLLLEHTNAERGALLVPDGAGLRLAATAYADRSDIKVVDDAPQLAAERVPDLVIEHVHRRRQPLGGRPEELPPRLAADRYLRGQRPAALLCTPIMREDRLMAVLYLEHRHLSTWFGMAHLDLLDVLCAQAAIALDNASMHARLLEANQVLDATFDRLPVGLILLGPDLTVRRASPRAVAVTGLPIHPGTPLVELFDVLTPTDADGLPYRLEPGFQPISEHSQPIHRDVVIIQPDGDRQLIHTAAIPLRDAAGGLIGVTLLVAPASGLTADAG